MDDHDLNELEDPATWEDDEGTLHPPVQHPKAVVAVRLTLQEVARLEHEATALGMLLPEFVRHAALSWVNSADVVPEALPARRPA